MATAFDVAKFFLAKQDADAGDTISNMKLQKLVYYAQGFSLAITGIPLFQEEIEAWAHGPVVPALYSHYKAYGASSIPAPSDPLENIASAFSPEQIEVLEEVNDVYGQFSAWKLRNFTHDEKPWFDHYKTVAGNTIPLAELKAFFAERVESVG